MKINNMQSSEVEHRSQTCSWERYTETDYNSTAEKLLIE